MRVLVIKTSSLGDVIHTLPALTDAGKAFPSIRFDWVVEEGFVDIPRWHPLVDRVMPVALRRWRKNLFSSRTRAEWRQFYQVLREQEYDLVIDAQGLLKSAFVTRIARGETYSGLGWSSARESLASLFYRKKYAVAKGQHAVLRVRQLFAAALGYELPSGVPQYGVDRSRLVATPEEPPYLVFLHGTTWKTKHWPEQHWMELVNIANQQGYGVKLLWGNAEEKERAERIAQQSSQVLVLPRLGLMEIAQVLAGSEGIVAVDTGLGHLSAALDVPTVSLYGPTNPILTGALGESQVHLASALSCAPCLSRKCKLYIQSSLKLASPLYPPCLSGLVPAAVWAALFALLPSGDSSL